MKKRIVSCLIICVVLVLSFFYAHIDDNVYIYNEEADTATFYSTGTLSGDEQLTQTFVSEEDSIDGFNLKLELVGSVEDVILRYAILDENSDKVYEGIMTATELESKKFNVIKIPEIPDTKGKQYTIVLSEENADLQNGVSFYLSPGRQNGQELIIKGNETDATLVTRIICNRFDVETYVVLLGMIVFISTFMKILYKMFK